MSLRSQFTTDKSAETNGIELDFGSAVLTVKRAGGTNRKFKKALSKAMKPHRFAIEAETADDEQLLPGMIQSFVDEVLVKWETRRSNGELVLGIEGFNGVDGELIEFTKENAAKALAEMPDLFFSAQKAASNHAYFLKDREEAAKN